jgi:hypothetical protein
VRRLSVLSALLAALLGVVVLMGWALDLDALKGLSGQTTVKANTAVGFIAIAIALYALGGRDRGPLRVAGRAAAVLVAALALGTLSQDLLGWDLGIDQALVAESQSAAAIPHPGRMAPNAALCFVLLAVALVGLDARGRRARAMATGLALAASFLGYLSLLAQLADAGEALGLPGVTQMAAPTAVGLMICGLGVLFARPRRRSLRFFLGRQQRRRGPSVPGERPAVPGPGEHRARERRGPVRAACRPRRELDAHEPDSLAEGAAPPCSVGRLKLGPVVELLDPHRARRRGADAKLAEDALVEVVLDDLHSSVRVGEDVDRARLLETVREVGVAGD